MAGERHYPEGMLVCRFFHPPIKERSKCFLEKRVNAHCRLLGEFAHGASFSKSVFQFKFRLLMVRCGHKRAVVASAHELERASLFIVKRGDRYQRPLYQVLALDGASGVPARELGSERNGAVLAPVELGTFAAGKGDRPTHQSGITSKLNLTGLHGDASQFDALVSAVDFPTFVAGLIEGVFGAIVNASIEQMQAYERLLASVAKTVEPILEGCHRQHRGARCADAGICRHSLLARVASGVRPGAPLGIVPTCQARESCKDRGDNWVEEALNGLERRSGGVAARGRNPSAHRAQSPAIARHDTVDGNQPNRRHRRLDQRAHALIVSRTIGVPDHCLWTPELSQAVCRNAALPRLCKNDD